MWKPDQSKFFDRTKHEVVHRRKEELAEADPSDSKVAAQHEVGAGHKTVKRRKQEAAAVKQAKEEKATLRAQKIAAREAKKLKGVESFTCDGWVAKRGSKESSR